MSFFSKEKANQFIDSVFRNANTQKDDAVLKHAIRKLDEKNFWQRRWDLLEPFLAQAAINFSHSIDYVARVVAWRNRRFNDCDLNLWGEVITKQIAEHAKKGHDSDVCWMLWLARELSIRIDRDIVDIVMTRCGPLSLTLAASLREKGLIQRPYGARHFKDAIGTDAMTNEHWLFAFCLSKDFNMVPLRKIKEDGGIFELLAESDVSIFDSEAVPRVFVSDEEEITEVDNALEENIGGYDDDEDLVLTHDDFDEHIDVIGDDDQPF